MDWWTDRPEERYWCEMVVGRDDFGTRLHCPHVDEAGKRNWGYDLIHQIRSGDLVFHYKDQSVVGCSIAQGSVRDEDILWRANSTSARSRPGPATPRPGWTLALASFTPVRLSLQQIRTDERWTLALLDKLAASGAKPKAPLLVQSGQLRGAQTYLAKFPAALVARWDMLSAVAARLGRPPFQDEITDPIELTQAIAIRRRLRQAGYVRPAGVVEVPRRVQVTTTSFSRLVSVVDEVQRRAGGRCEACDATAPFTGDSGEPFLEVHHVCRLADGGPDRVENAVALCPNCHRAFHHASDRAARREALYGKLDVLVRYGR